MPEPLPPPSAAGSPAARPANQPRLVRQAGPSEISRHATWLELFFDLVFVVTVNRVAGVLHADLSATGLLHFGLLMVVVWWQWIDFSYYLDQYDNAALSHKLLLFGTMLLVMGLAVALPRTFTGGATDFTVAVIGLRMLLIIFYLRAWRSEPSTREMTGRYLLSFGVALGLWLGSLALPAPACYWLWALALLIEISNGPITYLTIRHVPQQVSHMDERFGLFFIIVLGEAVVRVGEGVAGAQSWVSREDGIGVLGFVLAAAGWWLYFLRANESVIHRALRSNRLGLLLSYVYGYSHCLLFAGVTAVGVGIEEAIREAHEPALSGGVALVLGAGLVVTLLSITLLQWATPRSLSAATLRLRLLVTAAGAGTAALSGLWGVLGTVGWVAAWLVTLVALEMRGLKDQPAPAE